MFRKPGLNWVVLNPELVKIFKMVRSPVTLQKELFRQHFPSLLGFRALPSRFPDTQAAKQQKRK